MHDLDSAKFAASAILASSFATRSIAPLSFSGTAWVLTKGSIIQASIRFEEGSSGLETHDQGKVNAWTVPAIITSNDDALVSATIEEQSPADVAAFRQAVIQHNGLDAPLQFF